MLVQRLQNRTELQRKEPLGVFDAILMRDGTVWLFSGRVGIRGSASGLGTGSEPASNLSWIKVDQLPAVVSVRAPGTDSVSRMRKVDPLFA